MPKTCCWNRLTLETGRKWNIVLGPMHLDFAANFTKENGTSSVISIQMQLCTCIVRKNNHCCYSPYNCRGSNVDMFVIWGNHWLYLHVSKCDHTGIGSTFWAVTRELHNLRHHKLRAFVYRLDVVFRGLSRTGLEFGEQFWSKVAQGIMISIKVT